jgi:hypothetical protein
VTRTIYTRASVEAMKAFTVHNRPFVKAAAVVSDSSLHRVAIKLISTFSGRRISVFGSRDDAIAWLATQR